MKASRAPSTLWEQTPPAERQAVVRDLNHKRQQEPPSKPQKRGGFNLVGYVRCEFSVADRDAFREWRAGQDVAALARSLLLLGDDGYLVKVGPSGSGFQVSLCAAQTGASWDGYVLVAHGGTVETAYLAAWYKHQVLMQADWSSWVDSDSEDSFR